MKRSSEFRKPRWEKWRHVPRIKLWHGVALSLNIEPDKVQHITHGWMADTHLFDEAQEFNDRMFVARTNLDDHPLLRPTKVVWGDPKACEVGLVDFIAWSQSIGWEVPSELVEIANTQRVAADAGTNQSKKWPWGDHETELLRMLAAAAHEFWSTYDPDQPSTAPRNEDVRDWLTGQNVSRRAAEVMAQILRPEDLPPGPRRK